MIENRQARRIKTRRHGQRGQSLVESALVLMVFLTLLIGILDVGQMLFVHQTLVERARKAVRYGVVRPFDAAAIQNMVLYNQTTVPSPPQGIFGLNASMVAVTRENPSLNEDRVVVKIQNYPFRFYTPFIAKAAQGKPIIATLPYEVP